MPPQHYPQKVSFVRKSSNRAVYSERGTYGSRRGWRRPTTAMWQGGASLLHHIIWNATELDCMHKFRDFLGSGRAVARLSDTICIEHHLSVIENPKRYTHSSYNNWLGDNAQPGRRDLLCEDIDAALQKRPKSFEEFLQFMQDAGYEIKRGKQITFCKSGQRNIRISSLQEGYLEKDIRAVIAGEKIHAPSSKLRFATPQKQAC